MLRWINVAVFSFALGVIVRDQAEDYRPQVKANEQDLAAWFPSTRVQKIEVRERMIYPIQCDQWIAQRGANEPWKVRCVDADLSKR